MTLQIPTFAPPTASATGVSSGAGDKLANATSLATLAKVTVARLPEHILQLSSLSAGTALSPIELKVPQNLAIDGSASYYLAKAGSGNPGQAVLLASTTQNLQATLSAPQQQQLTSELRQAIATAQPPQTLTVNARITEVSQHALTFRLEGGKNATVTLPLTASQHAISAGDRVTIQVNANPNGSWQINVRKAGAHAEPQGSLQQQLAAKSAFVDTIIQNQLKNHGLITQGSQGTSLPGLNLPGATNNLLTQQFTRLINDTVHIQRLTVGGVGKLQLSETMSSQLPATPSTLTSALGSKADVLAKLPSFTPTDKTALSASGSNPPTAASAKEPPVNNLLSEADKKLVHDSIIRLSRQLLAETGSTKAALTQLLQALNNPGQTVSTDSKNLAQQLYNKLSSGVTDIAPEAGGKSASSADGKPQTQPEPPKIQGLQSLFASPALPVTGLSLMAPPSSSQFLSGLITLLQVTLAGRAVRQQPGLAKAADNPDSVVARAAGLPQGGGAARVAQDFAQLDSRSQTLTQIKTLLANHQQQKLNNAEARIQGQDNFHFILPVTGEKQAPPEVLIRREDNPQEDSKSGTGKKTWLLTMKLEIEDLGQLLVKSRVTADTLDLNLYTSSESLLVKVGDTFPYLIRRLQALGLYIESSSFQRGKIPASLDEKPYHLFEATV
ncbi:flagellar hook-length control protein FliK [Alteromonas pelagimontana]|uniref:Flagellar hook-length control protein FliK n=1 Tax=Alteromonas pelagimontana TaxID=1858656 RepID=A0A6M4MF55_9ALTE|nr:flagellar hook-length control protein FliK [Alteromonas pelagimontana]QJR81732.1 flagellar hook-length control protein FliK [Alteromonas pelagimontana]